MSNRSIVKCKTSAWIIHRKQMHCPIHAIWDKSNAKQAQRTRTLAFYDWSSIGSRSESSPRGWRRTLSSTRDLYAGATRRALSTVGTVVSAVNGGHGATDGGLSTSPRQLRWQRGRGHGSQSASHGRRGRSHQAGARGGRSNGLPATSVGEGRPAVAGVLRGLCAMALLPLDE